MARRHEISRGLLWNWRRQVRRGELVAEPKPAFVPIHIIHKAPMALPAPSSSKEVAPADRIEIALPVTCPLRSRSHCGSPGWL
ncbi:MAG: hypothetical protein JOZ05_15640 [Acetobacteraceae bacterium]|nr:hypothetical protein [Acetobacteraceae bacterium]